MSVNVPNTRFMQSSLNWTAEFYQHLFKRVRSFHELGNRLTREAKQAIAFRQADKLNELGLILSNLPIKEYQLIGQYYCAWCAYRSGEITPLVFEKVAEASISHRASALITLAALEARKGNYESERHFLIESLKYSDSLSTAIRAHKGIAVIKAKEGYHEEALKDLENLYPMNRHANADVYFDYLNSYAVELAEAGRKDEARNVSRLVLASPFIHAYPEWRDTSDDLKEPNRSFITVPSIEPEPIEIEAIETCHASELEQPATVLAFPALKEAPKPQKPERLTPQQLAELTPSDMRELILAAVKTGVIRESQYIKMMEMVGLLKNGPADKILDLEDEETLNDIAVTWAHQIEPEELAAVLSALRDCEDRMRQRNILDRFIRIAFEETQLCGLTEEAWRLQFERRLPKK